MADAPEKIDRALPARLAWFSFSGWQERECRWFFQRARESRPVRGLRRVLAEARKRSGGAATGELHWALLGLAEALAGGGAKAEAVALCDEAIAVFRAAPEPWAAGVAGELERDAARWKRDLLADPTKERTTDASGSD